MKPFQFVVTSSAPDEEYVKVPAYASIMDEVIETDICHTHGSTYHLQEVGWKVLCFGHNDSRLTGGTWMYKGDEQLAHQMQQERWAVVKRQSDSYYSQCWV